MNHRSLPLCVLVTALGATHASAQSGIPNPTYEYDGAIPWVESAFGSAGTITRVISGDVTGDLRTDVFALGGSTGKVVLCLFAPGTNGGTFKLTESANDIDIAVGASSNGADQLYIVDSDGLRQVVYTGNPEEPFAAEPAVGGDWANAKMVRCGDVNANGEMDFVGLKNDTGGVTILYRRDDGSERVITATAPVQDIQLLHWATSATLQAAVRTSVGFGVYNLETGSELNAVADATVVSDAIAVVHVGAIGPDRLVWASHAPGNNALLKQYRRLGFNPNEDAGLDLGAEDVVSIVAGKSNGPSFGENLVVSFGTSGPPLELTNQASATSAPSFDMEEDHFQYVELPAGTQSQTLLPNVAPPVYRDLDNDGRSDLLLVVQDGEGTTFERMSDVGLVQGFIFDGAQFFLGTASGPGAELILDPITLEYEFAFQFPDDNSDYTHVELVIWEQASLVSSIEEKAAYWYRADLPHVDTRMKFTGIDLEGPEHSYDPCSAHIRWLEVRRVHVDELGKLTAADETYTAAIASGDSYDQLHGESPGYPAHPVVEPSVHDPFCQGSSGVSPLHEQTKRRKMSPPPGQTPTLPSEMIVTEVTQLQS